MLKNAREIFDITCNNSFKRYDLSQEWSQLNKQINNFKMTIGREPFIYELIPNLLVKMSIYSGYTTTIEFLYR